MDASHLRSVPLAKHVLVNRAEDILSVLDNCKSDQVPLSLRGAAHSMGGQSFLAGSVRISTTSYNRVDVLRSDCRCVLELDEILKHHHLKPGMMKDMLSGLPKNEIVYIADSGATWCDVAREIGTCGIAIRTMQSYCSFSIGGTLSVNGHGITSDECVASSVVAVSVALPPTKTRGAKLMWCSRRLNPKLFKHVLGGYSLCGLMCSCILRGDENRRVGAPTYVEVNNVDRLLAETAPRPNGSGLRLTRVNLNELMEHGRFSATVLVLPNGATACEARQEQLPPVPRGNKDDTFVYNKAMRRALDSRLLRKYRAIYETKVIKRFLDIPDVTGKTVNHVMYESANVVSETTRYLRRENTHILQEYFIPPVKKVLSRNLLVKSPLTLSR